MKRIHDIILHTLWAVGMESSCVPRPVCVNIDSSIEVEYVRFICDKNWREKNVDSKINLTNQPELIEVDFAVWDTVTVTMQQNLTLKTILEIKKNSLFKNDSHQLNPKVSAFWLVFLPKLYEKKEPTKKEKKVTKRNSLPMVKSFGFRN